MIPNKPTEKVQRKFVTSLLTVSDTKVLPELEKAADYIVCIRDLNMKKLLLKSSWYSNRGNADGI